MRFARFSIGFPTGLSAGESQVIEVIGARVKGIGKTENKSFRYSRIASLVGQLERGGVNGRDIEVTKLFSRTTPEAVGHGV